MKKYDNEKEISNEKKKKGSLLISLIGALVSTLLFYIRFGDVAELFSSEGNNNWAYYVFLLVVFCISFTIIFLFTKGIIGVKKEITQEEKERKRTIKAELIFLFLDIIATFMFTYYSWANLVSQNGLMSIAEVAVFFALVWMILELFNYFKWFPNKLLMFFSNFLLYVCIPMLGLIIIMLGAYQVQYDYQDIFTPAVTESAVEIGNVMENAYLNLVFTLYNIGQSNPTLWTWLPIAAFFLFTLILLINTFTKKEKIDEEFSAQELIDIVLEEEREEKSYESGAKKRPLSYNLFKRINNWMKTKRDIARELKEKEEEKKYLDVDIYNIILERRSDKK